MKKKLIIAIPVLLIVGFLGYKMFGPKPPVPKMKIEGVLAPLDPEYMINLQDGRFAKVKIALELDHADELAVELAAAGSHGGGEAIAHPQNSILRSIITDEFTGQRAEDLMDRSKRGALLEEAARRINDQSDAKVKKVIITDITVD